MEITTNRLLLREFEFTDWPELLAYQSDPRYLEYYPWISRTPEKVQEFITRQINQQQEQPRSKFQLVVVLRAENRLIGNCGIRMKRASAHEADLGYELSPLYWGQGYATEAARAMVAFGFGELNVHRIWSWCIADNIRSVRVLEKVGMRLEGRLRENEYFKGRWWDTLIYGILEGEWQGV